jgi:hypothetical protein
MAGATFLIPLITVIPGQLITAALWNNEWNNVGTNFNPPGMDGYSDTDAQMRLQTNPFPGSVTSHSTNLGGEIERIRYQIATLLGTTYWYQPPPGPILFNIAGIVAMGGGKLTGLGAGTGAGDSIRYEQVYGQVLFLTGGSLSGPLAMGTNKITGLAAGTIAGDATRYEQVLLLTGGTMSGPITMGASSPIAMGTNKITGLGNGTATQDAITFGQLPAQTGTITNWAALGGVTLSAGFGTISNLSVFSRRVGDTMRCRGFFTVGTAAAAQAYIILPQVIDLTKIPNNSHVLGTWFNLVNANTNLYTGGITGILFCDLSQTQRLYLANAESGFGFSKINGNDALQSATNFTFEFEIPVSGWSI